MQYRDAMHGKGKRVLFYNPDVTGVHPEAMRCVYGVGLWRLRADGMMNWHYCEHPHGGSYRISTRQGHEPMDFVFPTVEGHAGGPTIGWEAAREGVKDYQVLDTLDRLVTEARRSSDSDLRRDADQASQEVDEFISRLRFDTIDPVSALTLPEWDREEVDERGVKYLHGQYKMRNGFAMEDYDRLRQLVCRWILKLNQG
jgi:hypothetical protein